MQTITKDDAFQQRRYNIHEFEELLRMPENANRLLELVNGKVIEKVPTLQHGFIAASLAARLNEFALPRKLGWAVVEGHHAIPEDKNNSLLPDISYLTADHPFVEKGIAPFMPSLAIEIKSPDDTIKQIREKAHYYLANGSQLVWLIYPQQRMIEVYSPDADDQILFGSDILTGGDLLPGFTIPVAEIFATPAERMGKR